MATRLHKSCDIARPSPHNYSHSQSALAAHAMMVAIKGVCDKPFVVFKFPLAALVPCVLPSGHDGDCYPCPLNFQLCQGAKCPNNR